MIAQKQNKNAELSENWTIVSGIQRILVSGIRLTTVPDFELFSFVVQVPVMGHPRFGLPLEESVVQLLVVDVDLTQLWPHLSKKN